MKTPFNVDGKYCYHATSLHNIQSIIKHGLLSTSKKESMKIEHDNIANGGIQARRKIMNVPCGQKGVVHNYVPFYLCSTNPMMLSLVHSKNIDQQFLIFIVISLKKAFENDAVFTDASANTDIPPSFYSEIDDLTKLDWTAINKTQWGSSDVDEKHRRMAEILIYDEVPISICESIIVWNSEIKNAIVDEFKSAGLPIPNITFSPFNGRHFYYTKFMINKPDYSLTTGPYFLKKSFDEAIKKINDNRKVKRKNYSFKNIKDILLNIEKDFSAILELEGIFELETRNDVHSENVSDHTKKVVENLIEGDQFNNFDEVDQDILRLSAFLHDIGKGPKSKWKDGVQNAYPDHPADAAPMLIRILTEEIENLKPYEIRMLCLLVIYHDLIGEIIGKGRDIQQLFDVVKDEEEFSMLSALNYADVKAINSLWAMEYRNSCKRIKKEFKEQLGK